MYIAVFFITLLLWVFWALHCNKWTGRDRRILIDAIYRYDNEDMRLHSRMFDRVSYDRHMWRRVFGRNWRQLYPDELRHLVGW